MPLDQRIAIAARSRDALGIYVFFFSALLRLNARAIAWPKEYHFSGDRANTDWAILERALTDISLIGMILGAVMIFAAYYRSLTRP